MVLILLVLLSSFAFAQTGCFVRAVVFAGYCCHTASIFKRLNILTLTKISKLQTACFVYKVLNNLLPSQFNSFFTPNYMVHYSTRQHSKLHPACCRIKIHADSIHIYGVDIWNSLTSKLQSSPTLSSFMNKYKHLLLDSNTTD